MPLDSSTHQPQPGFQALSFDPAHCRTDLDAFEHLLLNKAELSERDDILVVVAPLAGQCEVVQDRRSALGPSEDMLD